jgi:cytidylate kinase
MSLHLTEKLILRQINHWNRMRQFLHDREETPGDPPTPGPVITISRQAGSGGRRLAQALAERWNLDLHDQSLVERIAREVNLEQEIVGQLDERTVSQARLWVQGVLHKRLFLKDDYHTALVRIVTSLAARGGVVFLGRGANLILGVRATLRIRVVAPPALRLENLIERTGLSRPEARALRDETDRRREDFVRRVFGEEPGTPHNFDLVFNSDRLDLEQMVEAATLVLLARVDREALAART